jgi:hypothetical protein
MCKLRLAALNHGEADSDVRVSGNSKALFTSSVFSHPRDVGISGDLVFTQYSPIPSNTLPWWRVFNLVKNTLVWRGFVGISRDYPLPTRPSKQPIRDFPGYGIIPSDPLKYTKSKQGLTWLWSYVVLAVTLSHYLVFYALVGRFLVDWSIYNYESHLYTEADNRDILHKVVISCFTIVITWFRKSYLHGSTEKIKYLSSVVRT